MDIPELDKKVERLRAVTDAKLKYLRDHSKFLDQAFEELKEVQHEELDVIHGKIKDLEHRVSSLEK